MTTSTEHHDAQLAAIKARHAEIAKKFSDPSVTRVGPDEMVAATFSQLALCSVMVDPIGRFWRVDGVNGAEMVFDPGPRSIGYSHGDRPAGWVTALGDMGPLGGDEGDGGAAMRGRLLNLINSGGATVADPDDTQAAQGFPAKEG